MPYCVKCDYWLRGSKPTLRGVACPNCGNQPFNERRRVNHSGFWGFRPAIIVLGWACIVGILGDIHNFTGALAFGGGIVVAAILFYRAAMRSDHKRLDEVEPVRHKFAALQQRLDQLTNQSYELFEALRAESAEGSELSERGARRLTLLESAWSSRMKRIQLMESELWARKVQLWLNHVEGLLAERLPQLNRINGKDVMGELRRLLTAGHELVKKAVPEAAMSAVAQRALAVLNRCLATAPELEERLKDAHVLAIVGDDTELPPELTEGGTWLHWLQESIPTIDLLPEEFTEDEEYLQVQTALRMLRDGAKFPSNESLDQPRGSLDDRRDDEPDSRV